MVNNVSHSELKFLIIFVAIAFINIITKTISLLNKHKLYLTIFNFILIKIIVEEVRICFIMHWNNIRYIYIQG